MSDIHATIRKFERFLSSHGSYYNNCTEVRPDTKGALPDEITNYNNTKHIVDKNDLKEIAKITYYPDIEKIEIKENPEILGTVRFDFEKETIREFYHKSRGKK